MPVFDCDDRCMIASDYYQNEGVLDQTESGKKARYFQDGAE